MIDKTIIFVMCSYICTQDILGSDKYSSLVRHAMSAGTQVVYNHKTNTFFARHSGIDKKGEWIETILSRKLDGCQESWQAERFIISDFEGFPDLWHSVVADPEVLDFLRGKIQAKVIKKS